MSYTRKRRHGGGLFNFLSSKPTSSSLNNLKAKRNFNLSRSKSRVANVLATPGQFSYTDKEAIEARYQKAIQQLQSIEKPQETVSALKTITNSLQSAIESQRVRETGAVIITIPVGVAQLALKAFRVFLSVLIVVFVDLPLGFMSGSMAVNMAAAVAPNKSFNTTAAAYAKARAFTGANKQGTVKNY